MNFGYAVKLCRQHRRLTLRDIAHRTRLSPSYISQLENDRRDPTLASMIKIAEALELSLFAVLFLGAEPGDLAGFDKALQGEIARTALEILSEQKRA